MGFQSKKPLWVYVNGDQTATNFKKGTGSREWMTTDTNTWDAGIRVEALVSRDGKTITFTVYATQGSTGGKQSVELTKLTAENIKLLVDHQNNQSRNSQPIDPSTLDNQDNSNANVSP